MKTILTILSILMLYITTSAQKLPNVQKESVLAPANVKVDGNANEWNNQFKAYNNGTQVFYTIANDNNNLYLVVQVIKPNIIEKIIQGGITFTIKNSASGKITPLSVTFPLIPKPKWQEFLKSPNDTLLKVNAVLVKVNNDLDAASKEIKLSGCKDIADSSISVYNDYGIKAAQLFNSSRAWTYELAIPLKYINKLT
jgi:hypothetical protein